MGEGESFVGSLVVGVNKVQGVVSTGWKINMLVYFGNYSQEVCMMKITSKDDKSIWMRCLLLTDGLIQFTQCLSFCSAVIGWRDLHSDQ